MFIIFVNATALTSGGGLTTLKQFLENIPEEDDCTYYIFCSDNSLEQIFSKKYLHFVYPCFKTGIYRIYWDYIGLKKWSQKNKITPDLIISMQNTTVCFQNDKIPQISYIMQAIPFVKYNWSLLKKQERSLWFYKYIYPFFMSRFLDQKHYVVTQSKWIKYEFAKKFNFPINKIYSIRPLIKLNFTDKKIDFSPDFYHIFCPSSPFKYKNNIEIVNALYHLKLTQRLPIKIKIYITINEIDDIELLKKIQLFGLSEYFTFIGRICYEEMLKYYNSVDLVVFPSYLETFGLPLLEAASFGKPILATNEAYCREVISNYKGATLIDVFNPEQWANAIEMNIKRKQQYDRYQANFEDSWKDFFILIKKILNKEV